MRNYISILLIGFSLTGFSQTKPVQIVFDITSADTLTHQALLRHVSGLAKAHPDAQLEVVVYGGALPMVMSVDSPSGKAIEELAIQKNISFKICRLSMERYGVEEADLIQGVEVVPDAIIEIVARQGEGWGYIKESHN